MAQVYPLAYTRYTKTHWFLYVRRLISVPGYTRGPSRVRVRPYRYVTYRLAARSRYSKRRLSRRIQEAPKRARVPKRVPKRVDPKRWVPRRVWFRELLDAYEHFDKRRSDMPSPIYRWFGREIDYLSPKPRYPSLEDRFAIVTLYLMVWHKDDEKHMLFAQRLLLEGRQRRFHYVAAHVHDLVEAQTDKLEAPERVRGQNLITGGGYIEVRGLVGWSLIPEKIYEVKRKIRRGRSARFLIKRELEAFKRRYRRGRITRSEYLTGIEIIKQRAR